SRLRSRRRYSRSRRPRRHKSRSPAPNSRRQGFGRDQSLRFAATPDSFSAYLLREKGSATKLESASLFAGELNTSPASAIHPDQPRCSVPKRSAGASLRCEERLAQTLTSAGWRTVQRFTRRQAHAASNGTERIVSRISFLTVTSNPGSLHPLTLRSRSIRQ